MPICGVCGEDEERVYRCGECGRLFCSECGSMEVGLCIICQAELKEEDSGYS